jgi:glycosyltransferase involved in cell wall biosynthesis
MPKDKRPIICMAAINWEYLFQRPQQLMLKLVQMGHPVHYRNPSQALGEPTEVVPNLYIYEDYTKVPESVVKTAIYFVYFPAYAAGIEPGNEKFIIYDCADDFPEFTQYEDLMCERADLVVCCSETLVNKLSGKHPNILYLPNGVDVKHFCPSEQSIPTEMAAIRARGEAVIGFSGAMYKERVDVELLYFLAKNRPQWQIVIVGETYGWDFSSAPSNISYLGNHSYETLPHYIQCFDVGLIPFHDNQIARGTDPIKLYEYIAAGIPVVSRELLFLQRVDLPPIYTYTTQEECLIAIDQALANEKIGAGENRLVRWEFAERNSWDNRVETLLGEIKKLTGVQG